MKNRRILPVRVLAQERAWITQFALTHVFPEPGAKVPISEVFDKYCDFLARKDLGPTKLNIDGFGRLFPKSFRRGPGTIHGKTSKCVFDVRVLR